METTLTPESLAYSLSSACSGATALGWYNREKSLYHPTEDLEDYVASLDSIEKIQRWFNASKLGLTTELPLIDARIACLKYPNELWDHLVRLHPCWKHASPEAWNVFSASLVRYAEDERCLERFDTLHSNALLLPWNWNDNAKTASRLASMKFLWKKGIRPLESWIINWYHARNSDRMNDPALAARRESWNNWMADTILPAMTNFPNYAQLYVYVAKSSRLSINQSRVPRLELLLPHQPQLHLAAAWHNDPCWLSVRLPENLAWLDYTYLYRLLHPNSFYRFAPDLMNSKLNAPQQDLWNIAHSLHWTWPQLLEYVQGTDKKEGSLRLPVDFLER